MYASFRIVLSGQSGVNGQSAVSLVAEESNQGTLLYTIMGCGYTIVLYTMVGGWYTIVHNVGWWVHYCTVHNGGWWVHYRTQ